MTSNMRPGGLSLVLTLVLAGAAAFAGCGGGSSSPSDAHRDDATVSEVGPETNADSASQDAAATDVALDATSDTGVDTTSDAAVDTAPADTAGSTDGASDAVPSDASAATGGTIVVTNISINGTASPDFTCGMNGGTFKYTPFGTDGVMNVGCSNNLTGYAHLSVGFQTGSSLATATQADSGTVVTLQNALTVLSSTGSSIARTTPRHTITLTSWDEATLHAVGSFEATWDKPEAGNDSYGAFKATFDVYLKKP